MNQSAGTERRREGDLSELREIGVLLEVVAESAADDEARDRLESARRRVDLGIDALVEE